MKRLGPPAAVLFIGLGLAIFLGELARHYVRGAAIEGSVVAMGATIAFVGFYMIDPKDTLGGGTFLVTSIVSIVQIIRSGRRATDPVTTTTAVVETTKEEKGE